MNIAPGASIGVRPRAGIGAALENIAIAATIGIALGGAADGFVRDSGGLG